MLLSNEIISEWLITKEASLKSSSFLQYKRTAEIIVRETETMSMVEALDGQKLYNKLAEKYGLKTIRNIFTIANQILLFAFQSGYLDGIKKLTFKSKTVRKTQVDILTVKEQIALTNFLITDIDPSKFGVLLSLYTGIRLGELCGLCWEDFNLKRKSFFIRRTIQRIGEKGGKSYFSIDTPKTSTSEREIPFPPALQGIIVSQYKHQDKAHYVATGSNEFIQPRTYQNRLKIYLKKCGISDGYHFHTLRHTFASRAVELGFDIKSLSEILGHASVKTTLELYTHPSLDCKTKEMKKFSKFIKNNTQN